MKSQLTITFLIVFFTLGCKSTKEPSNSESSIPSEKQSLVKVKKEQILEKYWKLIVLNGEEITMSPNQTHEIYFMLKQNDNRLKGFAGCNTLVGSYKLSDGNRIKFSQIASTRMYCQHINDSDFLKVFELTDNYSITGDTLYLNIGKRAPLAVFEAIYFN